MRKIAKLNEKDRKALFHNTAAKMGMTDANYLKKGDNIKEKIIRVITEKNVNGVLFQIAESQIRIWHTLCSCHEWRARMSLH